jgi:hypothetical protein
VTSDFLERLDAAVEQRCACGCGTPISDLSPSGYFATEACAAQWHQPPTTPAQFDAEVFRVRVRGMLHGLARVLHAAGEQLRPLMQQFAQCAAGCGHELEQPPSDPLGRVLWLRRRRNTGPRPAPRAARRVDPPGGLRCDARGRPSYRPAR